MKNLLFILYIALSITGIYAQNQSIIFNHLTTDDGLSQFSVNSLYVDEEGILWIGTREGLNCYNGNGIQTFKLEKNNPNSLFCNSILQVTGDQDGKIYLLCTDGVAEFNMVTLKFRTLLLQDNVNGIYYKDQLFISKKNKIYTFNETNQKFDLYYILPEKNAVICSMHIDNKNNLWLGTDSKGVYKFASDKTLTHPIQNGNITHIFEDSTGEMWIGSWEYGLYRILADNEIINYRHNAQYSNSIASDFVRVCCEDNFGKIWIGTFKGLNCFNKKSGKFESTSSTPNQTTGLTHPSIWCIVKDQQGTLWLGTYFGGVNYFNPEYEIYTRYKTSDTESKGLSSPIIGRMAEDKHGNLWICTEGGGVNVYNRKKGTYKWFRQEEGSNSISHNNVKAIYYDEKNEIMWLGTHMGGLNKLDLRTHKFTQYQMIENDPTSLPSNIVRDITPYNKYLIIGTQNGVCLFDPQTGLCKQLFKDSKEGNSIKMVADLYIDKEKTLWIAATGKGVYSYNFNTKKLTNYHHDPQDINSISSNNINSIMQDSNGNLWFSTSGSGLDLYRKDKNNFENFDMQKNGLISDCIYEVCESSAQKGRLLLITNQGFSIFDNKTHTFQNYNAENGFPLTAVNENALYITHDGEVFLGGVQGMISFNEKNLRFTPKPYNIILTELSVNGSTITPGDDTGILEESIHYTPQITLKADQSVFSIEYTTSNFIPVNHDEIYYRLEGFSNIWNKASRSQSIITYTNLNAGTYTLKIKSDREDVKEKQIIIRVLPPWYKTWWAYTIYALIISILLWYLINTYKSRIKLRESLKYEQKRRQDIESLNQYKLRFFTNISHEFRTPLTLIVGQIEVLLQIKTFTPSIYNKILGVYKNSLQLKELISELLDFRKQEQGHMKIKVSRHNLVDFLYENYLLFLEFASSKQINFKFHKSNDSIEVWYDQKQLQKVINNLLSNAIKHTKEEDTITIHVKEENNLGIIEIQDTGSGIDATEVDKIFDRFYQTEQTTTKEINAGTGIGLALTKGIVELHHGTIQVKSKVGKGSSFIVSLPLGNKHFSPEEISLEKEEDQGQRIVQQPEQVDHQPEKLSDLEDENASSYKPISGAKMLIVEDNESIRQMLSGIFEPLYKIVTAVDGQEGLEKVRTEMPSIVVSDVVMPNMSGTELCKEIKNDFNICHIPVVLLTARTAIEHNIEGLRIGADDYITKPFNTNILISRCNNLVNSRILLQEKFSKQPQVFAQMLATNPLDKEMLDRAMEIIEKNLDNTEFNVNFFAREMGMARTNLFTKLKAITGQTPNDFILTIRLKKGAVMLRNNPELNISEISDLVGFSSSRYFSKCFKEVYNLSPMGYRRGDNVEDAEKKEEESLD